MTAIKLILIALFSSLALIFSAQQAQAWNPFQQSCSDGNTSTTCNQEKQQGANGSDPTLDIIQSAANIIAIVAGIAAVILIILGGISYVTAGGNQEQTVVARRRILGAVIGVIVVALAWTITTFVVDHFVQ